MAFAQTGNWIILLVPERRKSNRRPAFFRTLFFIASQIVENALEKS